MPNSTVSLSGSLSDFRNPNAQFTLNASGDLSELGGPLRLPPPHTGKVTFVGSGTYSQPASFQLTGKISGRGLAVEQNGVRVNNVALDSELRLSEGQLQLSDLRLNALGGSFKGSLALAGGFKNLKLKGQLSGFALRTLARPKASGIRRGTEPFPAPSNSRHLQKGRRDLKAAGTLEITPNPDLPPFEGKVDFAFDQRQRRLDWALLPKHSGQPGEFHRHARSAVTGVLETRDLGDLLPVIAMVSPSSAPPGIPVRIAPGGT